MRGESVAASALFPFDRCASPLLLEMRWTASWELPQSADILVRRCVGYTGPMSPNDWSSLAATRLQAGSKPV